MPTTRDYAAVIEKVAAELYYDVEYEIAPLPDIKSWEDADSFTQAAFRNRAVRVVRALGIDMEWGVRSFQSIGDIETTFTSETIAEIVFQEMEDEEPERNPRLIRRVVGYWEEMDQ